MAVPTTQTLLLGCRDPNVGSQEYRENLHASCPLPLRGTLLWPRPLWFGSSPRMDISRRLLEPLPTIRPMWAVWVARAERGLGPMAPIPEPQG